MNNDKLVNRQNELKSQAEKLVAASTEVDQKVQELLQQKEQIKRNFDAVSGALQLIEELLAPVGDGSQLELVK